AGPGCAGAALYSATWRRLLPLLFAALGESRMDSSSRGMYLVTQLLEAPASPWWEGQEVGGRDEVLAAATDQAAEELTELLGDTPADWRWGEIGRASCRERGLVGGDVGLVQ